MLLVARRGATDSGATDTGECAEPRVRRGQVRRGTNHKRLVRQTPMSQGRYGFFYAKYDEKAWCDGGRFRASTAARTLARRPGEFERQGRAGAGRG